MLTSATEGTLCALWQLKESRVEEESSVLVRAVTVQVIHSVAPAAHSVQSLAAIGGAIAVGVAVRGVRFAAAAIFIAAVALLRRERFFLR